jgi:hypothetical protein
MPTLKIGTRMCEAGNGRFCAKRIACSSCPLSAARIASKRPRRSWRGPEPAKGSKNMEALPATKRARGNHPQPGDQRDLKLSLGWSSWAVQERQRS